MYKKKRKKENDKKEIEKEKKEKLRCNFLHFPAQFVAELSQRLVFPTFVVRHGLKCAIDAMSGQ